MEVIIVLVGAFFGLCLVHYQHTMEKLKLRNIIVELECEIDVLEHKLEECRDQNIRIKTYADK